MNKPAPSTVVRKQALEDLKAKYPQALDMDWSKVFAQDPVILGAVIGDALKIKHKQGRPGRRDAPTKDAFRRLHKLEVPDEEDNENNKEVST